jgi:hypothetical protein
MRPYAHTKTGEWRRDNPTRRRRRVLKRVGDRGSKTVVRQRARDELLAQESA